MESRLEQKNSEIIGLLTEIEDLKEQLGRDKLRGKGENGVE